MFGIGQGELALILLFAFMVFGPDKLPGAGRTLGRALRQFRQAQEGFSKVVQTEVINPMTEDPKEGPSIEDELDADIDADVDSDDSGTSQVKPHHKETFAERKARLDAERKAKEEAEAQKAALSAAAENNEGFVVSSEEDTESSESGQADNFAASHTPAAETEVAGEEADTKAQDMPQAESGVQDAPATASSSEDATEQADSDAQGEGEMAEESDAEAEPQADTEADSESDSEAGTDRLAALYGLSGNSLERVQEVSAKLDERDAKRKEEAEALTPKSVVEAALNDESTSETTSDQEAEPAPQPKRVVAAARKKPRSSRPQTTEPGKGEGTE